MLAPSQLGLRPCIPPLLKPLLVLIRMKMWLRKRAGASMCPSS